MDLIDTFRKSDRFYLLTSGAGSGSKFFQSLLDGHQSLIMIPGYPLMYLPVFMKSRKFHILKEEDLNIYLKILMGQFSPIFDSNQRVGSETLNKLGLNRNESLTVNKQKFCAAFKEIYRNSGKSYLTIGEVILVIHLAYWLALGKSIQSNSIILYHIHEDVFIDYIDVPYRQIVMTRCPHSNYERRVGNSFDKANRTKLTETTSNCISHYGAAAVSQLYYLAEFSSNHKSTHVYIKHEDLVVNRKEALNDFCKSLNIKYDKVIENESFGGKVWNSDFYQWVGKAEGLPNYSIIDSQDLNQKNPCEVYECLRIACIHYKYYERFKYNIPAFSRFAGRRTIVQYITCILPSYTETRLIFRFITSIPTIIINGIDEAKEFADGGVLPYDDNLFYTLKVMNRIFNHDKYDKLIKFSLFCRTRRRGIIFARIFYELNVLNEVIKGFVSIPIYIMKRIGFDLLSVYQYNNSKLR